VSGLQAFVLKYHREIEANTMVVFRGKKTYKRLRKSVAWDNMGLNMAIKTVIIIAIKLMASPPTTAKAPYLRILTPPTMMYAKYTNIKLIRNNPVI
jgi:hypothetical protein